MTPITAPVSLFSRPNADIDAKRSENQPQHYLYMGYHFKVTLEIPNPGGRRVPMLDVPTLPGTPPRPVRAANVFGYGRRAAR